VATDSFVRTGSVLRDLELRHRIDSCIGRALFDDAYASRLLSDPTLVLGERDCPPQDYLSLRGINASSLSEFAQQAQSLFWLNGAAWLPGPDLRPHDDVDQFARHENDSLHACVGDVLFDAR
jgi:hypothetical protein